MAVERTPEDGEGPPPCAPCRGTGRVISQLGGTRDEVTCPWCDGTGRQLPGHDAQEARRKAAAGVQDRVDESTT